MSLSIRGRKIYKASEAKKLNRPNFNHESSESDTSESDSDDGNIVQKRSTVDFMQPIKKLREEISRLGQSKVRDDLLNVPSDYHSDSAANETDTSRASTERIALEGKEIHLKKKRLRRKKRNTAAKCENTRKIKGVDDKMKSKTSTAPDGKNENEHKNHVIDKSNVIRGYSVFEKSQENLDCCKNYSESLKTYFRSENQQDTVINSPRQHPIIITDLWEPPDTKEEKGSCNDRKTSKNFLEVERNSSVSRATSLCSLHAESDKNLSTSAGEHSDTSPRSLQYGTNLERVLRKLENNEKRSKYRFADEGGIAQALSITAPEIRDRQRSWKSAKVSVEYFREWKYKIDETRRNCEDMLTKLRYFKENNSKIKFQDILRKRLEEEARAMQKDSRRKWEKAGDLNFDGGAGLNITSSSGAVVPVSDGIPKIKVRSRPLLPATNAIRQSLTPIMASKNYNRR